MKLITLTLLSFATATMVENDCNASTEDINGDGHVTITDLLTVVSDWGLVHSPADIDANGVVNAKDLVAVIDIMFEPNANLLDQELLAKSACVDTTPNEIYSLLNSGADVNCRSFISQTNGKRKRLHQLNGSGWTPLMFAVTFNSNSKVVSALIDSGAEVNCRVDDNRNAAFHRWTPLMLALSNNANNETLIAILDAGAEVNVMGRWSDGHRDLQYIGADNNNPSFLFVFRYILGSGEEFYSGDINDLGVTPLMIALAMESNFNTIFTLINAGASVNARSENGDTPLKLATRYCRDSKIIELLLSAGAQKTPKQLNNLLNTTDYPLDGEMCGAFKFCSFKKAFKLH